MLARTGELPRDDENWAYEIKWDGVRAIGYVDGGRLRLEARSGLAEVAPARGLDAEDARAELGEVQVDLENAALRPEQLDPDREPGLEALAQPAPAVPEEEVLRDLLAQRARAAHAAAVGPLAQRVLDRLEVEAAVAEVGKVCVEMKKLCGSFQGDVKTRLAQGFRLFTARRPQ